VRTNQGKPDLERTNVPEKDKNSCNMIPAHWLLVDDERQQQSYKSEKRESLAQQSTTDMNGSWTPTCGQCPDQQLLLLQIP
jgi:hypothetical protein